MSLYGIKNCDTVKKARKWLDANGYTVEFHDFREQGLDEQTLDFWLSQTDWSVLLNKRSTSFRELTDAEKADLDQPKAKQLMLNNPTLVKRPVLVFNQQVHVGFKAEQYQAIFA